MPLRLAALLAILLASLPVLAQPGALDPSFDDDGRLLVDFSPSETSGQASSVALLPDGRIVVAGTGWAGLPRDESLVVTRLLADGRLDPAFGGDGRVSVPFADGGLRGAAVALYPDGRIVVAGAAGSFVDSESDFAVVRILPDGSLDPSFGDGGIVTTSLIDGLEGASAIAILPDGKIVAAGGIYDAATFRSSIALVRYELDGRLDTSFGEGGARVVTFPSSLDERAAALAVLDDGRLLVAGHAIPTAGTNADFALARFSPDGDLDSAFGAGGLASADFGGRDDFGYGLAVQPDGRVIVAGLTSASLGSDDTDTGLVRFLPDGTLDPSFGEGGLVRTSFSDRKDSVTGIVLQPDGRIVVAGSTFIGLHGYGHDYDFLVARYEANGNLDVAFGEQGHSTAALGPNQDHARALALQPDGRIVAAGMADAIVGGQTTILFAVARFLGGTTVAVEPGAPARPPLTLAIPEPHPFADHARLSLTVHDAGPVRVALYDALGRAVALLHDGHLPAGTHALRLEGRALTPGVYVARAEGRGGVAVRRVVRR